MSEKLKGWLWVQNAPSSLMDRYYPIGNVEDIRDIGIKKGDTLHLKGVGSFRVLRTFAGTHSFTITVE